MKNIAHQHSMCQDKQREHGEGISACGLTAEAATKDWRWCTHITGHPLSQPNLVVYSTKAAAVQVAAHGEVIGHRHPGLASTLEIRTKTTFAAAKSGQICSNDTDTSCWRPLGERELVKHSPILRQSPAKVRVGGCCDRRVSSGMQVSKQVMTTAIAIYINRNAAAFYVKQDNLLHARHVGAPEFSVNTNYRAIILN